MNIITPQKLENAKRKVKRGAKITAIALPIVTTAAFVGLYQVNQFFGSHTLRFQSPVQSPVVIEPRVPATSPVIDEAKAEAPAAEDKEDPLSIKAGKPAPHVAHETKPVVAKKPAGGYLADVPANYAEFDRQAAARLTPAQAKLLKRIGEAESGFQMKPNSSKASSAYGIFQILKVHDKRGNRFDLKDHIRMAIDIFLEQGTAPWISSKHRANGTGWGD